MRALLAAAVVALSVTAAHAQEVKPVAPAAKDSVARALPPAAMTPTSTLIEQLKSVGELKEPKGVEAPAPKVETSDAKPAEAKSIEAKPVEAKPVEAAKPAETKPAESKAVEKKAESKPVETSQARPVKKQIVRKRETDEQKARRIAAKYGISW
jgi:hypothetical protein